MTLDRALFVRLVGSVLLLFAGYLLVLFVFQRRILFPSPPVGAGPARPGGAQAVWIESPAGRTEAWFLPPLGGSSAPAPLLFFAHGNGELIDFWPEAFVEVRRLGLAVLLVEYPGYGRSGGSPSRTSIRAAFEAAYDWASSSAGVDARRIVFYGRSLGGAVVAELSSSRRAAALILESSFTSTMALAGRFLSPSFLVRDRFDTLAAVERYRGPLLVLHGAADEVVPVEHGRKLAAAGRVEPLILECGHNDCPGPWTMLPRFLREAGVLGPGA
jgi:fermentation-respiration switch protein FrsA (DUF1100 family)